MSAAVGSPRVAVLQMSATPGDVDGNVAAVVALVRQYGADADLVVTPELVTSGYDLDLLATSALDLAQPLDGPAVAAVAAAATATAATVVLGLLERDGDAVYDSAVTIDPDGAVSNYRKTHLYPTELSLFAAGTTLTTVATRTARIGPMICFEHAFPEIATTLALAGSDVLVIPSAVGDGFEHLLTLRSRARAQDNQLFVVACNQSGHGFCGHSLIADPRGDVIASSGAEPAVLTATLDLALIAPEREHEPTLSLRRPQLYGTRPSG
jgi:predicted amidohydrolase